MSKPTKTKEELTKLGKMVQSRLSEIYDDFIVVGFVAGTDQPLQICQTASEKGRLALEAAVSYIEIPDREKDDEANTGS